MCKKGDGEGGGKIEDFSNVATSSERIRVWDVVSCQASAGK